MKIAIISPHFAEYSLNYANGLAASGADVLLFVDDREATDAFAGRPMRAAASVKVLTSRFALPVSALRIVREIAAFQPSAIHIQEPSGLQRAAIVALLCTAFGGRTPILLTVHDPKPHAGRDSRVAQRIELLRRFTRRRAHLIVVHGAYCLRAFREAWRDETKRVFASTHGVILAPNPEEMREIAEPSFVFFGRMEAYKGLGVLVRAIEILRTEGVLAPVTIAGRGEELDALAPRLAMLANVKVEKRYFTNGELIGIIQSASCATAPYTEATQSAVVAAAFANGRPVIASDVGGLPDVVEDGVNGLLTPPGDAAALAGAMRQVVENSELAARLRRGAVESAVTLFSWDRIAAELATEIRRLVEARSATRRA